MGLDVEVGGLGPSAASDPDLAASLSRDLARLNKIITDRGLKSHKEPRSVSTSDYFSCQMWGYAGLHYLRRIALYLREGDVLPEPGPANSSELFNENFHAMEAKYLNEYQNVVLKPKTAGYFSLSKKLFGLSTGRRDNSYIPFSHLLIHEDTNGIYLPQPFRDIFVLDPAGEVLGSHIGSSQTLLQECKQIAGHLKIPGDLDVESPELWNAIDTQGEGHAQWQRYAIETFICVRLMRACEISIKTGALIIFC